jgi:CRP-like cAMP-binding protein
MSGLASVGALAELSGAQLERLRAFLEERSLADGAPVFLSDEESRELIWIAEGSVRLARGGRDEGVVEAGSLLGALSLSVVGTRACEARAQGPARVYALGRESYLRMRSDDPELALLLQEAILRELAQDLRAVLG